MKKGLLTLDTMRLSTFMAWLVHVYNSVWFGRSPCLDANHKVLRSVTQAIDYLLTQLRNILITVDRCR